MATEIVLGYIRQAEPPYFDQGSKFALRAPSGGGGDGTYHLSGGYYDLEIIQPIAGLDTKNRFYKAYPGLEFNVRLAVIGGYFPYEFELTTAPAGMSIDGRGEITWSSPTESGSPHSITAVVTDANGDSTSVSWTLTVTTSGFRFIDAVNGTSAASGGNGSIGNPWRSMIDFYGGTTNADKNTDTYADEFLYWRAGTYQMDAHREDSDRRTPFVNDNKPQVWLAYPGETAVIDLANAYISVYAGGDNLYIDGIEFNVNSNVRGMGIVVVGSADNVTMRKNTFYGITNGFSGGNNALVFIGSDSTNGYNWAFQDNTMSGVNEGYGILGYAAQKVLIENNQYSSISPHPVGPKESTGRWVVRQDEFSSNSGNSISLQYSDTGALLSGDIEILYNLVNNGGGKVRINSNFTDNGLPVYTYRNTFVCEVEVNNAETTNGPFSFTENVIINETAHPEKIERVAIADASRVIVTDNLTGASAGSIVDGNGELTASYSEFIGTRGHVIAEIVE